MEEVLGMRSSLGHLGLETFSLLIIPWLELLLLLLAANCPVTGVRLQSLTRACFGSHPRHMSYGQRERKRVTAQRRVCLAIYLWPLAVPRARVRRGMSVARLCDVPSADQRVSDSSLPSEVRDGSKMDPAPPYAAARYGNRVSLETGDLKTAPGFVTARSWSLASRFAGS
ncbi:hypothetical protein B0H67DRAFT_119958 [Lasiosphaeris hirsuta]|uniref:Uncharacterized protein n=1 Tax=Lasiosphaeris hirsuta TaxID=260670 RepID=A0AA40AZT9_9PEZI|nr:hypothetical protein B0H67DRAFT_119958 [Lasiosphaeris hirsuta]